MNKRTLVCLLGYLVFSMWCGASDEYLQNPGFEEEWGIWQTTGTVQQILRGNWQTLSSRWSMGFGNDHGPTNAYGRAIQDVVLPKALSAGRSCVLKVFVMMEADYSGKFQIALEFRDAQDELLSSAYRDFPRGGREKWKERVLTTVAPAKTKYIRVILLSEEMKSGSGRSFIWMDNTSLRFQ